MSEGFGLTHYLPFVLRRASLLESPRLRRLQREAGVEPGFRYELLLALRQFPNGVYVDRLAKTAHIRQPTVTKALNAMERDGLITREDGGVLEGDKLDRRRVLVRLTAAGAIEAAKAAGVAMEHMTAMEKAAPELVAQPVLDALRSIGEVPARGNV